jgi:hypothetical protein
MRGRGWIGEGPRRRGVRGIVEKGVGRVTGFGSVILRIVGMVVVVVVVVVERLALEYKTSKAE